MNLAPFVCIMAITACFVTPDQGTTKDSSVVFAGTTPCNNIIRPLHKITPEADCPIKECLCFMVEWKLTLYKDPVTQEPTSYKLTGINRFSVKETNMYSQPGTKTESSGKWIIVRGTKTNPAATVYRLNPDKPEIALNLFKLNDNLLHILDHDGKLLVGNEFFSYTLSQVVN
jgi:hypothetical protein